MSPILLEYLRNFWLLLSAISPYILIGIFLAAIMKMVIREEWIRRELGDASLKNSLKAILLGIPLPLCSCSVIPFATALRKSGASRSSTLSFLIATPITGVDSIAATYGVLGWFFTLYRVLSSIVIALLAGLLSLLFDPEPSDGGVSRGGGVEGSEAGRPILASDSRFIPVTEPPAAGVKQWIAPTGVGPDCTDGCCGSAAGTGVTGGRSRWKELWHQAVETIFGDFAPALLIGIALGALLVTFVPPQVGEYLGENLWLNYLLVIAVAAPLYICATSSIPLGVALLAAGVSPGAVFVFLTAGPASSTVTMSVVKKVLGVRSLILYLAAVISGTLLFGFLFDTLFADRAAAVRAMVAESDAPGPIGQIAAVLLLALAAKVLLPGRRSDGCCG